MARLFALFNSIDRYAGPAIGPLTSRWRQKRHESTLRRGAPDKRALIQAKATWWGEDERWFPGGAPPRQQNHVTPLIDGDAYFGRLLKAISEAQEYVYIAGWCLTPYVPLARSSSEELAESRLVEVLSAVAERLPVRVLLWAGAPFVLEPTRGTARQAKQLLEERARGDLRCALDETATASHCHHQKAIVVDGQLAFVGGMDLTTYAGDRWDANPHKPRSGVNWHDVQALIEGEAVADVEQNFRQRWEAVTGESDLPHRAPEFKRSWNTPAQIVRTIPAGCYEFAPNGEFGIRHAYLGAIRRAKRFVYLETQYLWAPEIMAALIDAMNAAHDEPFRIVIVLPAEATSGKWNNDLQVEELRKADRERGIAEVYSLHSSGPCAGPEPFRHEPTYVHAKVAVIDDEWFTIGSANLNDRGFITDGEMNVVSVDPDVALSLRSELWAEHLRVSKDEVARVDPVLLIDTIWRECAARNAEVMKNGHTPLATSVRTYQCSKRPGSGLLKRIQSLTLEH